MSQGARKTREFIAALRRLRLCIAFILPEVSVRGRSVTCAPAREGRVARALITHDLSTAYQISDDIYILYGGSVMENGDIELAMFRESYILVGAEDASAIRRV